MPGHNFQFSDGSVRALQCGRSTTLAAIAQELRSRGPGVRAVAWGAEMPALQALLSSLQRQGVSTRGLTVPPARDPLPVLMVIAEQWDVTAGPGAVTLFLLADNGPATPLLLPAVQSAREAARRIAPDETVDLVLVQRPPGPGPRLATEQWAFNFTRVDLS